MTCIVGVVEEGMTSIGGDRAAISNWVNHNLLEPKVCRLGDWVAGFTGSVRHEQIVKYHAADAFEAHPEPTEENIVRNIIPHIRNALITQGQMGKTKEHEEEFQGAMLVGRMGKLFGIFGDLQVCSYEDGYEAIGGAREPALGALNVLTNYVPRLSSDMVVRIALESAYKHNIDVRGPYDIEEA